MPVYSVRLIVHYFSVTFFKHLKVNSDRVFFIALSLIFAGCVSNSREAGQGIISGRGIVVKNGIVVTAHPVASEVGARILEQGGNAFDAATAVR